MHSMAHILLLDLGHACSMVVWLLTVENRINSKALQLSCTCYKWIYFLCIINLICNITNRSCYQMKFASRSDFSCMFGWWFLIGKCPGDLACPEVAGSW